MGNMDTSMDEFFGAFEGADGNQTDTEEIVTESEPTEDTAESTVEESASEGEEATESVETAEEESNQGADKDGAEGKQKPENKDSEQKFVVKVNSETKEVSYADAPAWIQKGMDYDRVKEQLATERKNSQDLQSKLDQQGEYIDTLKLVSEVSNIPVPELLERLHVNAIKKEGQTEAEVRAQIRADKLERQLKAQTEQHSEQKKEQDQANERMERDIQEFRTAFPDVTLTEELAGKLAADIRAGMSLTSAYLKMENQRLRQEAEQQKQAVAAAAKNKSNRAKAPGSQRDSGGQKAKAAEDDFFAAFEK